MSSRKIVIISPESFYRILVDSFGSLPAKLRVPFTPPAIVRSLERGEEGEEIEEKAEKVVRFYGKNPINPLPFEFVLPFDPLPRDSAWRERYCSILRSNELIRVEKWFGALTPLVC